MNFWSSQSDSRHAAHSPLASASAWLTSCLRLRLAHSICSSTCSSICSSSSRARAVQSRKDVRECGRTERGVRVERHELLLGKLRAERRRRAQVAPRRIVLTCVAVRGSFWSRFARHTKQAVWVDGEKGQLEFKMRGIDNGAPLLRWISPRCVYAWHATRPLPPLRVIAESSSRKAPNKGVRTMTSIGAD